MKRDTMFLKNIKVSNFKNFENISVDLKRFNVLVGANASGKSNFVSIFGFLKDVVDSGLDNALSLQGGIDYIRNINLGSSQNLSVELHVDAEDVPVFPIGEKGGKFLGAFPFEFLHRFSIDFPKKGKKYEITEEIIETDIKLVYFEEENGLVKETGVSERNKITFTKKNGKIEYDINEEIERDLEKYAVPYLLTKKIMENGSFKRKLFLESETPLFFMPIDFQLKNFIRDISLYDFDPKLSRKATQITGKTELEPDGSNLAIVLKNILEDRKKAEEFSCILRSVLPFIQRVKVQKVIDRSLITNLKEIYSEDEFLPAFLISDGTINITALIIALYFEEKPFVIVEEPERNIHPYLISRIVEMMKDVSETMKKRQIIITTHNPEVVKYTDIDHLLFIYRDENGFSRISRPSEKEEVKTFLENDVSIEELYVQNLLEW